MGVGVTVGAHADSGVVCLQGSPSTYSPARQLQRESLSLTSKRSSNWANRSRDVQSRKKDLRISDSSDDDEDFPGRKPYTPTITKRSPVPAASGSSTKLGASQTNSHRSVVTVSQSSFQHLLPPAWMDQDELAAWHAAMALRSQDDQILPADLNRKLTDPWEKPTVIHTKRCLRPVTPEGEYSKSRESSRPSSSAEPFDNPWEAPVVIHARRCVRPVTPEMSPELGPANPPGESGRAHSDFVRLASVESVEPDASPWSAPRVMHAKRCLKPVTAEFGPAALPSGAGVELMPMMDGLENDDSPWEAPVVIHAKRTIRPVTPEGSDVASEETSWPDETGSSQESFFEGGGGLEKDVARVFSKPLRGTDELHGQLQTAVADAVAKSISWLALTAGAPEEKREIKQKTYHDTQKQVWNLVDNDSSPKKIDIASTVATGGQGSLSPNSKRQRNIPAHRGKARVAREVSLLLDQSDGEEEPTPQSLEVRSITPRVDRVFQGGDDSDDDNLRMRRKVLANSNRVSRASLSATAGGESVQSLEDKDIAKSNNFKTGRVEKRVSKVMNPLRDAVWSDDDDDFPARKSVSPEKSINQDDEREEVMQAFRSARKIAVMERKAMHIAQGSDSDEDMPRMPAAAKPLRHVIEREVDQRLSRKARSSPAPSVSLSTLDAAEQEWILVQEEESKPQPLPSPASFLTPLRNSGRPNPARRPLGVGTLANRDRLGALDCMDAPL